MQEEQNFNTEKIKEAQQAGCCLGSDDYDYSKFSNLKDFCLDEELLAKFRPIAKKLNLSQESVELLLDIAYQMSKKQDVKFHEELDAKQAGLLDEYNRLFDEDSEIPNKNSLKIRQYMSVADDAYNQFASPKLKELFKSLGLNYHPELIKMFYKIGTLSSQDDILYSNKPPIEQLTPAQILYGKRD